MNNIKIGIITLFEGNYNYGAVLQAFSLESYCKALGYKCDIIRYLPNYEKASKNIILKSLEKIYFKIKRLSSFEELVWEICNQFAKVRTQKKREHLGLIQQEKFDDFIHKNISCSDVYTEETIYQVNKLYDIFICGSDQIWKPECYKDAYFLKFADKNKLKIAYAPSIAVKYLTDDEKKYMQPLIANLDAVSVREKNGADLLENMTGFRYPVVVDPVLLMPREFWIEKMNTDRLIDESYCFCYFLSPNYKAMKEIHNIANKRGQKLVCISSVAGSHLYLNKYVNIFLESIGPSEFLRLISDAETVYTDSFHGTVFSLLFKKEFWVFDRVVNCNSDSMSSRIDTLLEMYGIKSRKISEQNCSLDSIHGEVIEELDYKNVRKIVNSSRKYLEEALQIKNI